MIPKFDKVHNKFKFNNAHYSFNDLKEVAYSLVKEGDEYERIIGDFLLNWTSESNKICVKTSGSTGEPKKIFVKKQAMVNSAIATGDFFNLKPGNRALHCLPTNFIAGKMMLVRALILGLELDLTEPTSQPIFDYDVAYDFCAMLPMQLQNTYNYVNNIKTLIVGGAQVSNHLVDAIQNIPAEVYETYGMTETLTHIAVKPLNGKNKSNIFKVFSNVDIEQDDRDCLVIHANHLSDRNIITNDIVSIKSSHEFEWLGRFDNVINSGGLKLFPEQIERKISKSFDQRFLIASKQDDTLGEKVVLVIEGDTTELSNDIFKDLEKYEIPKEILFISHFKETSSGKIRRKKTLNTIK